jgi:hypothetical protein
MTFLRSRARGHARRLPMKTSRRGYQAGLCFAEPGCRPLGLRPQLGARRPPRIRSGRAGRARSRGAPWKLAQAPTLPFELPVEVAAPSRREAQHVEGDVNVRDRAGSDRDRERGEREGGGPASSQPRLPRCAHGAMTSQARLTTAASLQQMAHARQPGPHEAGPSRALAAPRTNSGACIVGLVGDHRCGRQDRSGQAVRLQIRHHRLDPLVGGRCLLEEKLPVTADNQRPQ